MNQTTDRVKPVSEVERQWQAHGLDCAVLRMDMGHRCGYVRVPADHPWYGLSYVDGRDGTRMPRDERGRMDLNRTEDWPDYKDRIESAVEVHGGLTYGDGEPRGCPAGWWFGFDCAHLHDTPEQWTEAAVAAEVERLAEQLAGVGK